jgi:hypothetical protein
MRVATIGRCLRFPIGLPFGPCARLRGKHGDCMRLWLPELAEKGFRRDRELGTPEPTAYEKPGKHAIHNRLIL